MANQTALIEPLTNRELEILEQLAKRLTAKEIANDLFISERTVKRHTANIYQKLGVNNRRQAVASASSLGILAAPTPEPHRL
ncbi:MAG: LuxR C-terminal-related transcriptional regulator [Anaerolineae bacterium]|nr:LuxR C-terminal-related transcriptional regulator [Anaerolineae bacterium]